MNPTNVCTELGQNCNSLAAAGNESLIAGSNGNCAYGTLAQFRAKFRPAIARLNAHMQFRMQFSPIIASRIAHLQFGVQFCWRIARAIAATPFFAHSKRRHPSATSLLQISHPFTAHINTACPLITRPRLSVAVLTPEQFQEILNLFQP